MYGRKSEKWGGPKGHRVAQSTIVYGTVAADTINGRHADSRGLLLLETRISIKTTVNYAALGHPMTFWATPFFRFPAIHLT